MLLHRWQQDLNVDTRQCIIVPYHVLELPEGKVGYPYVADLVITSSDLNQVQLNPDLKPQSA